MVKQHYRICALGLGLSLILLLSGLCLAQEEEEQQARLEGKITDVEKKPLADVEVQFKNQGTGQLMTLKSNKKGEFSIRTLFPGKYLLTAAKEGYVSHSLEVELEPGAAQGLSITLAKALSQEQQNQKDAYDSFQKGIALANEKKFDEAIVAFRTATELNPNFAEAYINVGMLLFQQAKDEEAEKALLKALELKPDEPKTKNTLGSLYFEKARVLLEADKIDEALEQLKTSYSYNPEYSYTSYLLGYAYSKNGNNEEAVKYFEAFLLKEPNAPQAAQVKDIVEKLKKQ
jgi:tetratricopeptide (TPR) repeat protein